MPIDLVALQKIAQQLPATADLSRNVPGTSELTTGWGAAANQSRFDAGAAKFQIRDGAIFIDSGTVVSAGIAAELEGRVGVAASDLDLRIHLTPAARPQVHQPLPRTQPNGTRAQPRRAGDAIAIIGPWNDPSLKRLDSGPLP